MGRDPDKVRPWHRVRWVPGSAPLPEPRILGSTRKVTQHEILVVSEAPWPAAGVFVRERICQVDQSGDRAWFVDRFSVDRNAAILDGHFLAGKTDEPFDVHHGRLLWETEGDQIPA